MPSKGEQRVLGSYRWHELGGPDSLARRRPLTPTRNAHSEELALEHSQGGLVLFLIYLLYEGSSTMSYVFWLVSSKAQHLCQQHIQRLKRHKASSDLHRSHTKNLLAPCD